MSGGQCGLEFFGFSTWIDLSPLYMQSSNLLTKVYHMFALQRIQVNVSMINSRTSNTKGNCEDRFG